MKYSIYFLASLILSTSAQAVVLNCEHTQGKGKFVVDTVNKSMFGLFGNTSIKIEENQLAYVIYGGTDSISYKGPQEAIITISRVDGAATSLALNTRHNFQCKVTQDKPAF